MGENTMNIKCIVSGWDFFLFFSQSPPESYMFVRNADSHEKHILNTFGKVLIHHE